MKKFFKNLMPMLLLVAGLGISPNLWANTSKTFTNGMYFYFNASSNTNWTGATFDLKWGWYWDSDNWNTQTWCENGNIITDNGNKIYYTTCPSTYQGYIQLMRMNPNNHDDQWCCTEKKSADTWDGNDNALTTPSGNKDWCNSWTPDWTTYCPPMSAVTITDNGTTTLSGMGTQSSPYLVEVGATIKVKASSTSAVADDNMTANYQFIDGSTTKQSYSSTSTYSFTASNTANTTYSLKVSARNNYNSTNGTAKESSVIYFKTVNVYTVTYEDNGATSGSVPTDATEYVSGTSVTVKSNSGSLAKTGYTFSGWNTTTDGTGDTYAAGSGTFSITSNTTLYAKWTENLTAVTISSNGNGTVSPSGTKDVGVATTQSVTATPDDGYHFDSWAVTGNAVINGNTLRGNGNGGTGTLTATFAETTYSITIVDGTAASTTAGCVTTGTATAATAAEGKKFDKWDLGTGITLVNCAVSDATITFHASQASTVTATYTDASKYNLNVVAGTGIESVSGEKLNQTTLPIVSEISATAKTGYTFAQWTATGAGSVNYTSGSETSANATVSVSVGSVTLTASATPNTNTAYTVKHYKQNLAGDGYDLADTDELTGTTDASVTPDVKNYEGFTAPSTRTVTIEGDGSTVVEYQYARKSYTLTWAGLEGAATQGGTPAGSVKYGAELIAPTVEKTGYNFTGWSPTVPATMPATNSTYTAQWTEKTVAIVPTVNEIGTAQSYTALASVSPIGIATTSVLTATTPLYGYKFTGWELSSNLVVTSGDATKDLQITVRTNGDGEAVTAQANYAEDLSSNWYLAGNGVFGGWGHDQAINMTKKAGESTIDKYYAEIEITTLKDEEFKVLDHSTSKYWANNGAWVNREYQHHNLEQNDNHANMIFKPDMVGTYKFMLDCTESKHRLTVTFPTSTTYDVDIYYDGVTKTTVEGGAFAKSITANIPQSMRFDQWVVEGETTHVSITDVNSQTTTFTASGEGAIIRAKFKVVGVMYLKASDVFGDAYVNFYSSKGYWDSDNSKGSGNSGSECMSKNNHMTKIGQTDIYYLDVSAGIGSWSWAQPFSFVNQSVNHENFSMCNVVYRSDYNDRLPLYVPRYGYITHYYINCHYYNDGIWMKYNDTYSGYKLWIKEQGHDETAQSITLNALSPGGYEFNTTLNLKSGTTYELQIYNENSEWYGVTGQTITASSCSNWHFWKGQENCKLTASDAGDYTFTLNLGSGEVIVSVEYPLSQNDYRVVAKKDSEDKWVGDLIKHSDVAKKDTTSFYNNNYTFQLQQYNGSDWSDVADQSIASAILPDSVRTQSIINFIVEQDGNDNATLAYEGVYTGNYYIRTDGVDGGWGDYKNNSDNKMDNYGSLIQADPEYQYDVYKAKWITSGKNVKFRIANDYSKAISDELKGDAVIGNDKEALPQSANVRFMWNSTTNQLKRAYLSGSANPSDRYLILEGDDKMFNATGDTLTEGKGKIAGLDDYELNFADKNNWVYQADIQAQPGCAVKLTAKYNGIVQYFIGKEGDGDDSRRKIIDGSGTNKYSLRAVYDFKTNRLVAGWIPDGTTINNNIVLGSDMLIERVGQDDASQIIFGGSEEASPSISEIQHIYGVLKLTKTSMLNATETSYDKCIYWISFPFDVKVSEIFGVEKYGEVWAISNYRGDLRAQKGWFKQDTETFWEFLKPSDIMKANVGYTLNLDPGYFNKDSSEPWKNSATEVAWYFPSIEENIGVVSLAQKDTTLAAQHCDIDRDFNIGTEQNPIMVNHKFTDSNWRVIGVPAFQNLRAPTFDPAPTPEQDKKIFGLTGFYEWDFEYNTYTAQSTSEYTFKATGAYMVQYEGKITWSNASAITTKNSAPWHASADSKSYSIKLEFGNEAYTDQTFVTLTEKASTDFVLNEDMMKIDNAGYPNIYSFAGNYNVAYNETKMDNQTVTLGVSAPKAGTYTFSMPKEFSGTAKLIDLVEGITTDLNVSNYSVDLNKGTYNDRFQLLLEVEAKAPTSMENVECGRWNVDGKTTKLLRDGNIYLINAGRVYNATGAELR